MEVNQVVERAIVMVVVIGYVVFLFFFKLRMKSLALVLTEMMRPYHLVVIYYTHCCLQTGGVRPY